MLQSNCRLLIDMGISSMQIEAAPPVAVTPKMEVAACPLCGSTQRQPAYQFDPFAIVLCTDCGVHYLSPRLTEAAMVEHYAQDSYFEAGETGYTSTGYSEQENTLRLTFRRFMRNMQRASLTGGSLLEIGCGYGYLLDEAKPYFKTRVGTDFSSGAVEKARLIADAVYEGGLEAIPANSLFDCIVAANVLEHTYQPVEFLSTLAGMLRPGGAMIMACPNMDSILRPLMGHRWPSFKVPEHTLYFNQKTLTRAMQDAGLTTISPFPFPHAFPLSLIVGKFGAGLSAGIGKIPVWVPTTMAAVCGRKLP
jgi:2-polyprenyl-3-methyl-5-hydroxy-6-metoxy-1,4-benzoquinol methylase